VLAAGASAAILSAPALSPVEESAATKAARLATEKKEKADKKAEAKRVEADDNKKKKEEKRKKADEGKMATPVPSAAFAPLADAEVAKLTGDAKTTYLTHLAAHFKAESDKANKALELKTAETDKANKALEAKTTELSEALDMLDDEGEDGDEDDEEVAHAPPSSKAGNDNAKAKANTALKSPDPKNSGWQEAPRGSGFEVTDRDGDDKPISVGEVRRLFAEEAAKKAPAATSPQKTSSFEAQMLARFPPALRRAFHLGQYVNAYSFHKALEGLDNLSAAPRSTGLQVSLSGAFLAKQGRTRLLEDMSTLRAALRKMPSFYIAARANMDEAAAYQLHSHFSKYTRTLDGLFDSAFHDSNPKLAAFRAATWDHNVRQQHDPMDFSQIDPLTNEYGVATPSSLFGVGGAGAILANAEAIEYATLRANSIHELQKSPKKRKSKNSSDDEGGSSSESSAPAQGPAKRPKLAAAPTPKAPKAPQVPSAPAAQQPVLPRATQQPTAVALPKLQLRAGAVDNNGAKIDTNVCKLFNHVRACGYRKCKFVHTCLWCASAAHGIHGKSKCMNRFVTANGGAPF
jgi:hypothetical protein